MEATAATLERRVRVIPATKTQGAIHSTHDGKKRVAAYCRVSTDSEEQLNSYEAQKSYYTQKIEDSPDWEMAGIYADEGISGTSMKKRTEFKKMITACKRGHIDLIITKSLSRFARNTVDCLETVRLLKANGIGVYFEKENINTLTESSEFLITLFSGFAQAESESLSKNVTWGKQKSAEAGKVDFQYKKMLGYRKGTDGQPEIVPEEAEIIRRIYRRYLAGCSLGQIKLELEQDNIPTAQKVERWSSAVIHNILTNEKYMGDALLQKTYITDCITKKVKKNMGERPMYYVENNHPAIISRETFDQVQKEMTRRSSKRKVLQKSGKTELGKYSGKYALTELLVCGECGSPYKRVTWARNGKKRIVWRCVSRLEFGTKYCHNSPTLDEDALHHAVLTAMNEYTAIRQEVCPDVLAMVEEAKRAMSQAGAMLLELKKRMDEVSQEQSNVLDRLLANMADAELNARMKALTDEKEALKAQILKVQQKEVSMAEQAAKRQQMWDSLMECSAGYTEFDDEFVRQIIQKITVEDADTIRIHFRDSDVVLEQGLE
ncbi:recombinase family protein [Dysosmobacter sp.]|uniref:recombinase family protein n=1 Tax=Dysosmobacter sp. TaxID=2591382 RepID=UPI003AB45315